MNPDMKKIREFAATAAEALTGLVDALDTDVQADVAAACLDHYGGARVHLGWLTRERTSLGHDAFLAKYPSKATAPTTRTDVVDLSMYPGANDVERAVSAFRATVKGAENMDYDTVFIAACEAKRTGKFVNLAGKR